MLGQHRSFFALYGNTVNTAARMAQNASPGTILASAHFVVKLASGYVPGLEYTSTSQGYKQVKGLGEVETFRLQVVTCKAYAVSRTTVNSEKAVGRLMTDEQDDVSGVQTESPAMLPTKRGELAREEHTSCAMQEVDRELVKRKRPSCPRKLSSVLRILN